jgi:hypothetical protein
VEQISRFFALFSSQVVSGSSNFLTEPRLDDLGNDPPFGGSLKNTEKWRNGRRHPCLVSVEGKAP